MLKNYFKIAIRNLLKYKTYTLINITGLSVGIAATILILFYIQFEFSYDKFHENADHIYRVSIVRLMEGKMPEDSPVFTPPIGPAMARDFPEVENFVRFTVNKTAYFSLENKQSIKVSGIRYADSTLFDVLSFQLIVGNPKTALVEPYSIVLTEKTAARIFGSDDPMGRIVKLDNADEYKITGIIKEPPANSHIQFNTLISFVTLYKDPHNYMDWNGGNQYYAYVKLTPDTAPEKVEAKFPDFMWGYINEMLANYGIKYEPYLQPLKDIHLYHDEYSDTGLTNIYIFSAIALLILLIACINFVNLTTARATKRAMEVGVRKVLGANKQNLIRQFLGESMLLTLVAFSVALLLVELFFPSYQALLNKEFKVSGLINMADFWGVLLAVFVVGIIAGSYPALYLSSFQAVKTLKGEVRSGANKERSRNILVVLQFAISITLIICTMLINRQLHFVKDKELGFNKEQIVVIPLISDEIKLKSETLKQELSNLPGILNVTASSEVPYAGFTSNGYIPEGFKNPIMIHVVDVDERFLETFDIDMVSGRNFSKEFSTDKTAYLVNETLARSLDWDDPIGKTITRNGDHKVIGVVKDFHYATMHSEIKPLILTNQPWRNRFDLLSVKINSNNISGTLNAIENTWRQFAQSAPFEYSFLDEAFDNLYKSEQRFQEVFFYFSFLAIVIALLGLFSLASFSTEQRTKEIGVRKVLGASVMGIIGLLSKEFLKLVVIANVVCWPIAWYAMHKWLQNFAYRIDMGWWIFALAGGLALVIALLTVSTQAVRAALANPVESLRYE
ncbi:MAG: ABC transporter permease [bacterium]